MEFKTLFNGTKRYRKVKCTISNCSMNFLIYSVTNFNFFTNISFQSGHHNKSVISGLEVISHPKNRFFSLRI